MLKVWFATSEAVPFAKSGGLADVAGTLPKALIKEGADVRVVMPKYGSIPQEYVEKMEYITHIYIKMGWRNQYCGIFKLIHDGVTFYFIDNEFYFGGNQLYGYIHEDIEKFAFFDKAALAILKVIDFKPDIIHTNDWQTAMMCVLLKAHYMYDDFYNGIKSVLTIHNLKYQGRYDKQTIFDVFELEEDYFSPDKLEFYGDADCLKGGMVYADAITTVSPTYAEEIKGPYFGEGLDGLLSARGASLSGILNGIDYDEWNAKTDKHIFENYDKRNVFSVKKRNKMKLQEQLGLEVRDDVFMLGLVSRLTSQKGIDLIEYVMDEMMEMDMQVVLLGSGDEKYEDSFRYFENKYKGRVVSYIGFDNHLAHNIYASCDAFLMPSQFEPCGLSQIISLRYGTLPIVRETGGLNDTVVAYNKFTGEGTGFSFANFNAHEMLYAIKTAYDLYNNENALYRALVKNAMNADFSWNKSAKTYIDLYEKLV